MPNRLDKLLYCRWYVMYIGKRFKILIDFSQAFEKIEIQVKLVLSMVWNTSETGFLHINRHRWTHGLHDKSLLGGEIQALSFRLRYFGKKFKSNSSDDNHVVESFCSTCLRRNPNHRNFGKVHFNSNTLRIIALLT